MAIIKKNMRIENLNVYFFLFVLTGISIITFLLFKPFLSAIFIAAVLAVVFYQPYQSLFLRFVKHAAWSAALTCVLVFLVIVLPFFGVLGVVAGEINTLAQNIFSRGTAEQRFVE